MTVYFHAAVGELTAHGDADVLGVARGQRFTGGYLD
jgi:hypothetical protein